MVGRQQPLPCGVLGELQGLLGLGHGSFLAHPLFQVLVAGQAILAVAFGTKLRAKEGRTNIA